LRWTWSKAYPLSALSTYRHIFNHNFELLILSGFFLTMTVSGKKQLMDILVTFTLKILSWPMTLLWLKRQFGSTCLFHIPILVNTLLTNDFVVIEETVWVNLPLSYSHINEYLFFKKKESFFSFWDMMNGLNIPRLVSHFERLKKKFHAQEENTTSEME